MVEFPLTELRTLQASIGAANAAKGFHQEGDALRYRVANPLIGKSPIVQEWAVSDATALRNYYANKLLLVVSEVVEAHDELRKGNDVDYEYYSSPGNDHMTPSEADEYLEVNGFPAKPEGFLSESVDAIIRLFDVLDEAKLDGPGMMQKKLIYNSFREKLHGKAF